MCVHLTLTRTLIVHPPPQQSSCILLCKSDRKAACAGQPNGFLQGKEGGATPQKKSKAHCRTGGWAVHYPNIQTSHLSVNPHNWVRGGLTAVWNGPKRIKLLKKRRKRRKRPTLSDDCAGTKVIQAFPGMVRGKRPSPPSTPPLPELPDGGERTPQHTVGGGGRRGRGWRSRARGGPGPGGTPPGACGKEGGLEDSHLLLPYPHVSLPCANDHTSISDPPLFSSVLFHKEVQRFPHMEGPGAGRRAPGEGVAEGGLGDLG